MVPADEDDHLSDCVDLDEANDEEWALMSCSMDRRGQCGQAGTEFCDFECPVMRSVRAQDRARAAAQANRKLKRTS